MLSTHLQIWYTTKKNVDELTNISFAFHTDGMGTINARIIVTVDENISGKYTLSELVGEDSVLSLGKEGYQNIFFNGGLTITEYLLDQNYPNPFNPSTTIKYQIPEDGLVTLKIYDILGKEIKTLVNEQKTTGRYEARFDASELATGVYLYRIKVNDFVSVKKMLLLR